MPARYYGVQNEVKAYCNRLQSETSIVVTPFVLKTLNDRVESLKRSGVWSRFGLGFNDNDGDAYLSIASVTDVIGRAEVLWFTRGIKSLGLWNNMVSWPLRSYQNVGTGSTVRSLGGLGDYNGTMINSPSWGLSGIQFAPSTTQHINCATGNSGSLLSSTFYTSTGQLLNMIVVTPMADDGVCLRAMDHGASSAGSDGVAVTVGGGNAGIYRGRYIAPGVRTRTGGNFDWVWDFPDSSYLYTINRPKSLITQVSNGNISTQADSNTLLSAVYSVLPTSFLNNLKIGAGYGASASSGSFVIPFAMIGNKSTSSTTLYTLYKSTLGNGLGLP